jgi:acetyl-CoA carboxylase carboxyl transferase subunit beta
MRVRRKERLRLTLRWRQMDRRRLAGEPEGSRSAEVPRREALYRPDLKDARAKTGRPTPHQGRRPRPGLADVVVAVQDFHFMGGSLGMAAGEAFIKGAETALEKKRRYVSSPPRAGRACRKASSR